MSASRPAPRAGACNRPVAIPTPTPISSPARNLVESTQHLAVGIAGIHPMCPSWRIGARHLPNTTRGGLRHEARCVHRDTRTGNRAPRSQHRMPCGSRHRVVRSASRECAAFLHPPRPRTFPRTNWSSNSEEYPSRVLDCRVVIPPQPCHRRPLTLLKVPGTPSDHRGSAIRSSASDDIPTAARCTAESTACAGSGHPRRSEACTKARGSNDRYEYDLHQAWGRAAGHDRRAGPPASGMGTPDTMVAEHVVRREWRPPQSVAYSASADGAAVRRLRSHVTRMGCRRTAAGANAARYSGAAARGSRHNGLTATFQRMAR
jgi:hypothetical protein